MIWKLDLFLSSGEGETLILLCSVAFRALMMDKVLKPSSSERDTPLSEHFRIYLMYMVFWVGLCVKLVGSYQFRGNKLPLDYTVSKLT